MCAVSVVAHDASRRDGVAAMMLTLLSLAAGTLVSEDLACVTAGLLVQRGVIDPWSAVLACATGIFAGDVGLWAAGRAFGRAALQWAWVARHLRGRTVTDLAEWLNRRAGRAILASRFLPGARLPLYVLAGVLRLPAARFSLWAAVAALAWTPLLVIATARLGDALVRQVLLPAPFAWTAPVAVALLVVVVVRTISGGGHVSRSGSPVSAPYCSRVCVAARRRWFVVCRW